MAREFPQLKGGYHVWGYWFGGVLCVLSLLSLSLGLVPLIKSLTKNKTILNLPGSNKIVLKLPGAYLAVGITEGLTPKDVQQIYDLNYSLTAKDEKEPLAIVKIPAKRFMTDKTEVQVPLFQFFIDATGTYFLDSGYPFDMPGPKFLAVLFHMDVTYVRTELIVGIMVFLVFGILGLTIIRKSYKAEKGG